MATATTNPVPLQVNYGLNLNGQKEAKSLAYSPSGRYLAICCSDGNILIYVPSLNPNAPYATIRGHESTVWDACFAPTEFGCVMASCGADCKIVIQRENPQTRCWEVLYVDDQNASVIRSVSFTNSPGSPPSDQYQMSALQPTSGVGLHLAAACLDGTVVVLSLQADHNWRKTAFPAHLGAVYVARWSGLECGQVNDDLMNPGRRLASGGQDGEVHVYIYDSTTGQYVLEQALTGHKRPVVDLAWMPPSDTREERIASLGDDGTAIIWTKPHNGHWSKQQMKPKVAPGSHHLGWSFDGSCIAASLKDGQPPLKLL